MQHPSLGLLFAALAALLILAAFFAGSETALMSLNRYRLRHRASEGSRGARLAEALLARPDRLIGLILFLSTLVNVATPILVGFIALRMGGEFLVAFGAALLAFVLLIFCEVAPKTFGALHPERLALPAAYIYTPAAVPALSLRLGHESASPMACCACSASRARWRRTP